MTPVGNNLSTVFQILRVVLVLVSRNRCAGAFVGREGRSILSRTFCIFVVRSLPLNNRQYVAQVTEYIWRPSQDSCPSSLRSSRLLAQVQQVTPKPVSAHTSYVLVEDIIFLDHIVYYLLGGRIDDQHLPLRRELAHFRDIELAGLHLLE